jgi:anaerobic magnesium-protoporphyrin IX monomethyl ester cyclase
LKRNLSDDMVIKSFEYAREYNIKTYGNTMFGIPGTTLKDDFYSFKFMKKLRLSVPTFGIFCPYPGTELTKYAIGKGLLDKNTKLDSEYSFKSVLNCYTEQEKNIQLRMRYLSPVFCSLPDFLIPFFKILLRINLTWLYYVIGSWYVTYKTSIKIFPKIYPLNPLIFIRILKDSMTLKNFTPQIRLRINVKTLAIASIITKANVSFK